MHPSQQYHEMQQQLPQGMGPGPGGIGGGARGGEGGYHMHQPQIGPLPQGQPVNPMAHVGGMNVGPQMYGLQSVGWDPLEVGCESFQLLDGLWRVVAMPL